MPESFKVEIPAELAPYLQEQPEKEVPLLLVLELYRENKISLRQAAGILKVPYRRMQEILGEHEIFAEMSPDDVEGELSYGLRRQ